MPGHMVSYDGSKRNEHHLELQGSQHGFVLNFLIKAGTSKATHLEMLPKLSATCQQAWASEHQGPVHLIPSRDKQSKLHCVSIVYSVLQQ